MKELKMNEIRWSLLLRVLTGAGAGLMAALILAPYITLARGPAPVVCLLCAGLGASAGVATLPFADDGRQLLVRSAVHFAVTSALFLLLMAQFYGWMWEGLLLLEGMLALLYVLIWLGRWIGWYAEVRQLRALLGLALGPSALKWRETLPYLPFALILCDGLPVLLRWLENGINGDIPVLTGLFLPYLLLPVAGFCSGLSLGKRQGVCPLYPAALFGCYLPMVYLLFNHTALFHCFMVAVPALLGNVLGWLYRRAIPKKNEEQAK